MRRDRRNVAEHKSAISPLEHLAMKAALLVVGALASWQSARAEVAPEIHDKCLKAADYTGCVNTQTYGASSPNPEVETCDRYDFCVAKKGNDSLGLPKLTGWAYKTLLTGDVKYMEVEGESMNSYGGFKVVWYVIEHKGDKRYIGVRSVRHWFDVGQASRPGYRQTFGPSQTSCSGYGSNGLASFFCNTTPPISTYIPGSPGRAAGIKQDLLITVTDCVDMTRATYVAGGGLWDRWKKLSVYELPSACKERESLPVLPMSL